MSKLLKRKRKTDPAACPNADLRPPADVSLSRIAAKNNSGGFIEIPVGTIPDFRNTAAKQTSSTTSNPPFDQEIVLCEVGSVESSLVSQRNPFVSVEHCHAKLPNFHLCKTEPNSSESEPIETVFPFSTFKTYSSTRFVRDHSSFEPQFTSNNTKHTILATVYNPNGESVSSEKQGEQYVVKPNTLIVVHPILKIRDTREFVAAIPIPRTGDAETDSQFLKRVVIARDTGIDSHVNIRVEESSFISAEADKSSLVLLDKDYKFIGKLKDFPVSIETTGPGRFFGDTENHGYIKQYDHPAHKLAASNLTTTTNNSASGLNRQIPTRFIKGVCAICDNCGISSQDLLACDRCKKPIKAPKLTNDPLLTNVVNNVEKHRVKKTGEQLVAGSSPYFASAGSTPTSTPRRATRRKAIVQEVTLCSSDEESGSVKTERNSLSTKEQSGPSNSPSTAVASTPIKISSANGVCSPINMNPLSCIPLQISSNSPYSTGGNLVRIDPTMSSTSEETDVTPEKVMAEIEEVLKGKDIKGSWTMLDCRSIRVGSYKHAPPETAPSLKQVFVSTHGIMFSLPHCVTGVIVKLCLPFKTILNVEGCWKKMPCLFVKTGPKHAAWIRKQLGMGNSVESENYYCPLEGLGNQKSVVLLMDRSVKDVERGVLMRVFGKTLNEICYDSAHKKLIEANPLKPPPQPIPATPTMLPINVAAKTSEPIIRSPQNEQEAPRVEPPKPDPQTQCSSFSNAREDMLEKPTEAKKLLKGEWGIELSAHDLESLRDEVYINDQIIDFWLKYMKQYLLSPEDRERTYVFSTFFYSKLTTKNKNENMKLPVAERRHIRVASWTKKEDLFNYDFILVPIVESSHWILAVICFPSMDGVYDCDTGELVHELKTKKGKEDSSRSKGRTNVTKLSPNTNQDSFNNGDDNHNGSSSSQSCGSQNIVPNLDLAKSRKPVTRKTTASSLPNIKQPCILIFDSLACDLRNKIYATLREYLRIEYKVKKGIDKEFSSVSMPGCMPRVPQQPNYCDCGLYLLQYAESFFTNPIKSYRPPLSLELKHWFHGSVTQKKRRYIYESVVELVRKNNPENLAFIPQLTFESADYSESQENPLENVVAIQKATEDEDVDVSNDFESSTMPTKSIQRQPLATSKPPAATALIPSRPPTSPTVMAVVLDHNYTPKVEPHPITKVKSPPKAPTVVPSATPIPVIPQPPPTIGPCEPSKISLTVPTLSIKSTTVSSTNVNSVNATQSPARKVPCYANANAPKKIITERKIECVSTASSEKVLPPCKGSRIGLLKLPAEIAPLIKGGNPSNNPAVIRFNVPNTNLSQTVQTRTINRVIVAQKPILAKSPSPTLPEKDCVRPVREKKDSWKVKEMKSHGDVNHEKAKQEPKSPQGAHSSNLSQHMMVPIANTMRDSVSKKVASSNSLKKQHDQRSQSPSKKRSKLDSDKS